MSLKSRLVAAREKWGVPVPSEAGPMSVEPLSQAITGGAEGKPAFEGGLGEARPDDAAGGKNVYLGHFFRLLPWEK